MTQIAPTNPRAFALVLALASVPTACGDSGSQTSGLSGGQQPTTATAGTDPTTGTSTVSSTMSDPTDSGGTVSGTGTTTGTVDPPTTGPDTTTSTTVEPGTSTTTTTGDETSTGSTTAPPDKIPCDTEETEVVPVPPSVLLILDKSGSMSMEQWDHDAKPQTADVTRWYSLHQVVEGVVTMFDSVVHFGVKLYPMIDAGSFEPTACVVDPGVEVPIAPMNANGVLAGIPAIDFEVLGGTPMETGLKRGFEYLKLLDPTLQRVAILVADGEISDTCAGENFLEAQAAVEDSFANFDIPTYVVGIDVDASTSEQLAALALAGGKPKPGPEPFYQTSNQGELQAAISQIVKDTLSCVIAVDPAPSEPELFEVHIDGQAVPEVASCAEDGYIWSVPHTEVTLCGAACDALKETGKVQALYFCTPG